jgi:CubicO group peptidase (beta-lactamase class C family)
MSPRAVVPWGVILLCVGASAQSPGPPGYSADEASRLRRAITLENWDDGGELSRFAYQHVSEIFPVAVIKRGGGPIAPLPVEPNPAIGRYVVESEGGRSVTLDQAMSEWPFDGFLIVHRGRIVYEQYPRMRPTDQHLMFSVTKAFVGMAVAILEDRGQVRLDRPTAEYIPDLKGTAWETTPVRDVLEMASGIETGEAAPDPYSDPLNKHYQLEASLGMLPKTAAMPEEVQKEETYRYLRTLRRVRPPGVEWEYSSASTAVLGWLVERVSGRILAEFLSDEVWSRMGAEADAQIMVNRNGIAVAHAGLVATLRDLARFGMLLTPSAQSVAGGGTAGRVFSEAVVRRITGGGRPEILATGKHPKWLHHVAYQWDGVTDKGDFFKGGFGDQLLYVAPRKDVVIAYFGTNSALDSKPYRFPLRAMVDELF